MYSLFFHFFSLLKLTVQNNLRLGSMVNDKASEKRQGYPSFTSVLRKLGSS